MMRKKRANLQGPLMLEAFAAGKETQPEVCAWFSGVMTQLETTPRKSSRHRGGDDDVGGGREHAMEYLSYDRTQV